MEAQTNFFAEIGGKLTNGFFKRNQFVNMDNMNETLISFAKKCDGKDVYVCAYFYESADKKVPDISTCNMIASPYLDFDGNINNEKDFIDLKTSLLVAIGAINQEFGIRPESLEIYFSGAKGFHIIIPYYLLGISPSKELNSDFKKFANYIKEKTGNKYIDTGIYDRRRLLRVAGTINSKTGLYKVPVTSKMLFEIKSFEELKKWASEPRTLYPEQGITTDKAAKAWKKITAMKEKVQEKKRVPIPDKKLPLMPCSKKLLEEGAIKGVRNNSAIVLASSLLQSGMNREEAEARLCEWNEKNDPPLSEQELMTTFRSAVHMINNGRMYGCSAYKELGMCVNSCQIRQKEIRGKQNGRVSKNSYYSRDVRSA